MTPAAYRDVMAMPDQDVWPAVIIGAGPAGAATAIHLARAGVRTLLLDRVTFPRDTVCGCCLNRNALTHLDRLDVLQDVLRAGATSVDHLTLRAFGRSISGALPSGRALSRRTFDALLVDAARDAGAIVRTGVSARVVPDGDAVRDDHRRIETSAGTLRASIVVIADGLHGSSLKDHPELQPRIAAGSRIGIATRLPNSSMLAPGELSMSCTPHGYVGLVRLEDGSMDCAAAVDPAWMRAQQGPAHAVCTLWDEAGAPRIDLSHAHWMGCAYLTRRRPDVAAGRLFIVGDAAGYVEPITGEGIGCALESAAAVAPIAIAAARRWTPALAREWSVHHAMRIRRRQRVCRMLAATVRRPRIMRAVLPILERAPWLISPAARSIGQPFGPPFGSSRARPAGVVT